MTNGVIRRRGGRPAALNEEQVYECRQNIKTTTLKSLANKFGTTTVTVWKARFKKSPYDFELKEVVEDEQYPARAEGSIHG